MFPRQAIRALIPRAARSTIAGTRPIALTINARSSALLLRTTTATPSPRPLSTAAAAPKISNPEMMCRQCEQTQDHYACTTVGVCGKTAETSVSCSWSSTSLSCLITEIIDSLGKYITSQIRLSCFFSQ